MFVRCYVVFCFVACGYIHIHVCVGVLIPLIETTRMQSLQELRAEKHRNLEEAQRVANENAMYGVMLSHPPFLLVFRFASFFSH